MKFHPRRKQGFDIGAALAEREVSRRLHAWVHDRLDVMDRMDAVSRAAARRRRHKRPRQ